MLIVILAIFFIWVILYDTHRFVIVRHTFTSDKVKKPFRMIMLSDMHNKQYGRENQLLIKAIEEQNPDAIVIAGDMLTANKKESFEPAVQLLSKLAEKYPVYYSNGNHEHKIRLYKEKFGEMYENYFSRLEEAGIRPLINAHVQLQDKGIAIYGLEIEHEYYQRYHTKPMKEKYLEHILGKGQEEYYTVLLAHNPEYFPEYAKWGADLVFSGHIHGGIMRLPVLGGVISPAIRFFPQYDGGLFHKDNSTMILGRGIGTHTPNVRVFNPAELIVVDVDRHDSSPPSKNSV